MEEMLSRRLARLDDPEDRGRRFAYEPALIVVDGGRGQLSAALRALAATGRSIPMIGLAKRLEEVYLPDHAEPLRIPRGSDALFLLQHVRDEAHRFAITYHRTLRGRGVRGSVLDSIPGIGKVLRFKDPKGTIIELFSEWSPLGKHHQVIGVGPLKLGHVAFIVEDARKSDYGLRTLIHAVVVSDLFLKK